MFIDPEDGKQKIFYLKTNGLSKLVTDKNLQTLKELMEDDNNKVLWLRTEQTIAVPHIVKVHDKDGRDGVQNQTVLINLWDYFKLAPPEKVLAKYFLNLPSKKLPETFESITVKG